MKRFKLFIIIIITTANIVYGQQKKIAYCSNQTSSEFLQIFVMNEDGSDKKQLTDLQENCMKPRWSPDGKQIVFYSDRGQIYLIREFETSSLSTPPFYVGPGYDPSFISQGDQIMYNNEFEDVLSIYAIDTSSFGAQPELISDGRYSNMQTLSHGGNKIIFSQFVGGYKNIMMADLDDTTDNYITKVSQNDEANLEPDISNDDKKITYASFDNNLKGTIRLYENGSERALSKGLPSSNVPRFSPDGNKIAFAVIDGSNVSLYIMNSDGSSRKHLNINGESVGTYQWIDNDRIVYDAGSESKTSVGLMNTKTEQGKILAEGGFNLQPSIQK